MEHYSNSDFEIMFELDEFGRNLHSAIQKYDVSASVNTRRVQRAFDLAKKCHAGQDRKSGEPYYSHPVEVAAIACRFECRTDIICGALLHDTVEDTGNSDSQISFLFGKDIARIVDGVTNLNMQDGVKLSVAINLYKVSQNRQAVLVKLCDRVHNTRTMEMLPPHKIKKKVHENISTYIPLAKEMKLDEIAKELESLSSNLLQRINGH